MNFANVTKLVIPQGEVIQIQDSLSRILWTKTPTSLPPYFYIEDISGQSNTITIKKRFTEWAPTITVEKSMDGKNWTRLGASSTSGISATIPANGRLYLRGNATTWSTDGQPNCIESSGNVKVGGNIMSLLYGSNFTGNETTFPSGSTYTFQSLFDLCKVVDAHDLVLPATTLVDSCYTNMFARVTMLKHAPSQLPALNLAEDCYAFMFYGCTSLYDVSYNMLPATKLARECYRYMFYGCTALTTAPELPATTLAVECYRFMFDSCTALTTTPVLPATTLAVDCYVCMFSNCTSLTTAPELPATKLARGCYRYMFYGCTSLYDVSYNMLPATKLDRGCYQYMFYGCTALTTAPELPATTLDMGCYQYMFRGCTSLTTAPTLPATTLVDDCYYNMFYDCTALSEVNCLATDISASNCLYYWLYNVAVSGTFYKKAGVAYPIDQWDIPNGWTVVDV